MTNKLKMFAAAAAISLTAALSVAPASAHTTAFGYKALTDGTVDFWIGSYHPFIENPAIEGSLTLTGPGATGPYAFGLSSSTLPTALDFYTENTLNGSINSWQGVNASGLLDGIFTADISGMNSAKWFRIGGVTGLPWPFTFTLNVVETADVPEPGTLALFGLGLAGLGFTRRKKAA